MTQLEPGHAARVMVRIDQPGERHKVRSALAWHTTHIERDRRASALFVATRPAGHEDALQGFRVTVLGAMVRAPASDRRRYLAEQPQAADYFDFLDFGFWRLEPEQVHAVAGFGRIMTFAAHEVFEPQHAAAIAAIEEEALDHMNRDHGDAVQLYATAVAGRARGSWRMAALDEDGFTLVDGVQSARIAFDRPVRNAAELRATLAEMAERARLASVC